MLGEIELPVLAGRMGDRDFFMTVMDLQTVSRYFETTPDNSPPELRAQRLLNEKRVPEMANYLLERDSDWVFGSLTVTFNSDYRLSTDAEDELPGHEARSMDDSWPANGCETLALASNTEFVVVDGQHRLAAIRRAISQNPTLRSQQIGVMLLPYEDLQRNQQVFSDLNRTVQKTSRSLDILYNHTDPLNGIVMTVGNRVPIFNTRVEKNSTSLALRSPKFITLSSLYDACGQLLGGPSAVAVLSEDEEVGAAAEEFCVKYWSALTEVIKPWNSVMEERIRPSEARIEYVAAHSVTFFALGAVGRQLFDIQSSEDWSNEHDFQRLLPLSQIDWAKTNPDWQGIVMLGPSIVTRRQTRDALTKRLLHVIDPDRFDDADSVLGD